MKNAEHNSILHFSFSVLHFSFPTTTLELQAAMTAIHRGVSFLPPY
jgi:hypothetical protein